MIEIYITTKSPHKTIKYLNKLNTNIYNIKYHKEGITLKTDQKSLNKIDKYYHYKIIKEYGKKELANYLKQNLIQIIYLITILILIILFTKITLSIEVISENASLRSHITNELEKLNLNKYTLIKTNEEIKNIKEKILNNNKDILEWINIERIGMKYIINIEPKITKTKEEQNEYCNVISSKDAIITKVITHKGVELVEQNDSVKKDQILISGDITYNEETKKQVCASGIVYGTTWYTIDISIPTTKETIKKLDKTRYNIILKYNNKTKQLLKDKYKDYIVKKKKIVNIFGIEIYIQKEIKIKKETTKYTEEELNILIDNKLNETLSHTLKGEYKIINRNTLKKYTNNSKIELEIFIVAEEQISTISK